MKTRKVKSIGETGEEASNGFYISLGCNICQQKQDAEFLYS
jgi:hypothetical protein